MDDNILGNKITEGISVITAVKNRTNHLKQSLQTWMNHKEVSEIIIIDWSSDEAVIGMVNGFSDSSNARKIVLVRVENEPKWILTQAYNLAIRCASKTKILKLDSDIKLTRDFFKKYKLNETSFFTGRWELARNKNESHLNGSIFANRKNLLEVNGYDERIIKYGWDDTDLYDRLGKNRLNRKAISPDYLIHIPHDDLLRTQHQNIDEAFKKNLNSLIVKHMHLTKSRTSWGKQASHQLTEFKVRKENNNYFICKRSPEKLYIAVTGNLVNRLRDYLIAKKMSEDIKRDLVLIWEANEDCDFIFSDLFKNNIDVRNNFNPNSFKQDTKFYFLDNENFNNQQLSENINTDIVIKARNGFSYENYTIKPAKDLSASLKQYIKQKFKKLIPKKPNASLLKNVLNNILKPETKTRKKSNDVLNKEMSKTNLKKINNYKKATTVIRTSLKKHIQDNNIKSLVLGVSDGINSMVCAALCKKVCKELNIPLIGAHMYMGQGGNNTLIKNIGSVFYNKFKEIDFSAEYNTYTNHMEGKDTEGFKHGLIMMYLHNLAEVNNGIVISTKSQMDSMLGFYEIENSNELNILDRLYKSEIIGLGKFLSNKDIRNVKEKRLLHKIINSPRKEKLEKLGVSSYEEAENILKEYLNGNSEFSQHPLIQGYKKNNFTKSSLIDRENLLN